MKITCDREKFLAAFQVAAAVAPARSPKPILQNVKLECTKDSAIIMATDLEIGIRVSVEGVDVSAPGSVILPLGRFGSILRESSDPSLKIETDGQITVVRGERSKFDLPAQNTDEFPAVTQFNQTKFHDVSARLLREMFRRTAFATDSENSRYALGGVLLEMGASSIITVGTDGRRLAKMEGPAAAKGPADAGVVVPIIPTKAVHLIERSLSDADAEVQVAVRDNDVLIQSPRVTIYTRLVEGRFPKWRDVFPKRTDAVKIEMAVGPFYSCVRQAAIVTNEHSRGVDFTFGNGKAVLAARAAESGQSHVEMPVAYDGTDITVCLDPRFMNDFLKVLDPEKVFTLEIKDSESAVVCHTEDEYSYVIMPLARDRT